MSRTTFGVKNIRMGKHMNYMAIIKAVTSCFSLGTWS